MGARFVTSPRGRKCHRCNGTWLNIDTRFWRYETFGTRNHGFVSLASDPAHCVVPMFVASLCPPIIVTRAFSYTRNCYTLHISLPTTRLCQNAAVLSNLRVHYEFDLSFYYRLLGQDFEVLGSAFADTDDVHRPWRTMLLCRCRLSHGRCGYRR